MATCLCVIRMPLARYQRDLAPSEVFRCLTPGYRCPIWASGEIGIVTNYLKMIFIGNGDAQKDLEAGFCLRSKGNLMLVLTGFSGVKSLPVRVWEGSSLFLHPWLSWMNTASPVCLVGERGRVARSRVSLTLHGTWDCLAALESIFPCMILSWKERNSVV